MTSVRRLSALLGLGTIVLSSVGFAIPAGASPMPTAAAPNPQLAPASIDSTGKADVTEKLQTFINRVPDGGTAELRPGASYRVDGTLVLDHRQNFDLDGNGAKLVATTTGTPGRSHLRVVGGSHLVIHDFEIDGDNPNGGVVDGPNRSDLGFQHGVVLEGSTDVELTRLRIQDVYGDFVYIGAGADAKWSERVWIHSSVFARSGRQGISVTGGRDVVIEHNIVTDTRRSSFDLEPNGPAGGADNIYIVDNTVGAGRLLFLAAVGAGPVNHVVVARNVLRERTMSMIVRGPGGQRRAGFWVVDNTSAAGSKSALGDFTRIDGVVVAGNKQPIRRAGVPTVEVDGVCGLIVSNNDVSPSTQSVAGVQTPCGTPPSPTPPATPNVAGRPVSAAGALPTAATTTTTTRPPEPTPVHPKLRASAGEGGTDWARWLRIALVFGLAGVAAIGLVAWVVLSERRARRPDGPQDAPRPPPS